MIFSMSFPVILRRTIGQNDFVESYEALLDFGIMTKVDFLK